NSRRREASGLRAATRGTARSASAAWALFSFFRSAFFHCAPDSFRRERHLLHAHADRVFDRVAYRRSDGENPALAHAFRAVRPAPAAFFQNDRLEIRRHIAEARQAIVDERAVHQLAVFIDEILEKCLADAEYRRALVLPAALLRIDHLARVGERNIIRQLRGTRLRIDFDLRRAEANLPERRWIAERHGGIFWHFEVAAADNFPFGGAEVTPHDLADRHRPAAAGELAVIQRDFVRGNAEQPGRRCDDLRARVAGSLLHRETHDRRGAARVRAFVEWGILRVELGCLDAVERDGQLVRDHLQESRAQPLTDLDRAGRIDDAAVQ